MIALARAFAVCKLAAVPILLCGCSGHKTQPDVAVAALFTIQQDFNRGSCASVSAKAETRTDAERKEWLDACEELQKRLGAWNTLNISYTHTLDPVSPEVDAEMVVATSQFIKDHNSENYRVESYWHIGGGKAHLYFLQLVGKDLEFSLPHQLPSRPTKIQDSPRVKPVG